MNNRSTADFVLVGIGGYRPNIGEEVIIEYSQCIGKPFKRIFAGHIRDISSRNDYCGRTVFHDVTCVDYNALLDKRLVFNIYESQPVTSVIKQIHKDFLKDERITLGNVNAGNLILQKAVFSYVKVSKAFNDISTATGLFWYIDYYRDLHFFLRSQLATSGVLSPDCDSFNTSNNEFCAFLNNETCNKGIKAGQILIKKRSDQLVNNQFVIAGQDETDLRTESFVGDGERQTFSLKYKVSTLKLNPDKTIASDAITLNGLDQTVGYRDDEQGGFDWYFEKGENVIVQDDAGTPITSNDELIVSYRGLFQVVVSSKNQNSVSTYGSIENTSGLYQDVHDDESIESRSYAQQYAEGLVRKFSRIPITINYVSDEQVLNIGEILSVNLNDHGINVQNGFLVNAIAINDIDGIIKRFEYELISSENLGDWQEYFRKIEFFGRQLKLREQQKLIIGEQLLEGIIATQEFSYDLGIGTLEVQDQNYERCLCHIGRAFSNYNFHCVPQVVKLGLV